MSRKNWNRKKVSDDIKELAKKGEKLNASSVYRNHRSLMDAARYHHGGWRKAVERCGINYSAMISDIRGAPRKWGREKILAEIKKIDKAGGKLNPSAIHPNMLRAAVVYFDSWENALTAAGKDYTKIRLTRIQPWTKEEIIEKIQARQKKNLPLYPHVMKEQDSSLYSAAHHVFGNQGGWNKALSAAGIDPKSVRPRKWTKERILREIWKRWNKHMLLDFTSIRDSEGQSLTSAARASFGSWKQAIKVAGLSYGNIRRIAPINWWTENRIVHHIRLLEKQGIRLNVKYMREIKPHLFHAAVKRFGSWSQAVYAAGVDYHMHCMVWSSKAWIRHLTTEDVQNIDNRTREINRKRKG